MAAFSYILDTSVSSNWRWKVVRQDGDVEPQTYAVTDAESRAQRLVTLLTADEEGA
jgi:hypothetical protein